MNLVNSGPLGAGAALAFIADVIGINVLDIRASAQLFVISLILLPLLILFVSYKLIKLLLVGSRAWPATCLVATVLFVGYPSHQWFSGFQHSNAGILVVLIAIFVYLGADSSTTKTVILAINVAVLSFVYLLYMPIVVFLLLKVIVFEILSVPTQGGRLVIGSAGLALLVTAIPIFLFCRAYGTSQLFLGGGIEQLPQVPMALLMGYGIGLVYQTTEQGLDRSRRILPQVLIIGSISVVAFSIWHSGYISYYPTKIAALFLIPILIFTISETTYQIQRNMWDMREKVARGGMLVLILSLLVCSGLNPNQYKSGDQGALRGVFSEIIKPERESDRGKLILALQQKAKMVDRPVLIEAKGMESEQISRWVSSLNFQFSDATWTDWTSVRTNYSIGEYSTAYKIASGDPLYSNSGKGVLIATDNPKMLSDLRAVGPGVYGCLIEENFTLTCG